MEVKPSFKNYVHAFALRYQGPVTMVGSLAFGLMMPYQSSGFLPDGVFQFAALIVSILDLTLQLPVYKYQSDDLFHWWNETDRKDPMPLSRIFGRTMIMAIHAAYVPYISYLLDGNWPTEAGEMSVSPVWAFQRTLVLMGQLLPHACTERLIVNGTNDVFRLLALLGWWSVGYFVLFIGFGRLIRQLPEYVREMWKKLKRSAAALAAREQQRQAH